MSLTSFCRNSVPLKLSLSFPKLSWAHSQPFSAYSHHNTNIPHIAYTFLLHKRLITNYNSLNSLYETHPSFFLTNFSQAHTLTQQKSFSLHTTHISLKDLGNHMMHWVGISLSVHTMPNNSFFITMQPLIFTYCFTMGCYNVFEIFWNFLY